MSEKVDKHVFMTIAEVCAELHPWSKFTTIKLNLMHFQVLARNNDFSSKTFKNTIIVIMSVLNRVYGFNDEKALEYTLKFLNSKSCLKFGEAAMLMHRHSTNFGNDRYLKMDAIGNVKLNI